MYSWIWRHIPFKQWPLKLLVSLAIIGGVTALLWYEVFPAVEPILPFDDVQVEGGDEVSTDSPVPSPLPS